MVVFHLLSVLSLVTWRGETNLFVKPCSHQMTVTAKAMSLQFKLLIQIQKVQIQLYFYLSFNRSESESTRKLLNCHWFCCCVCFSRCEQRIQLILSMDDSIDKGTLNLPLELQRKILHVSPNLSQLSFVPCKSFNINRPSVKICAKLLEGNITNKWVHRKC